MVQFITLPSPMNYQDSLILMEEHVDKVINGAAPETVYLLEHLDVYTAGTNYKQEELLNQNNIPVIYTGRGGKFTFHGKGQRVIYPVLNLNLLNRTKDLKLYVRMLEEWIINSLKHLGVEGYVIKDKVGIWVKIKDRVPSEFTHKEEFIGSTTHEPAASVKVSKNTNIESLPQSPQELGFGFAKIAAIGVRVRKWVTYHGIAVNISTDLSKFNGIIPCGLENSLITSLNQLGIYIEMPEFDKILETEFTKIFK